MTNDSLNNISQKLARIALEIGAIRFNPDNLFTWASGYRMPIYNDNRLLLGSAEHRNLVARGFREVIRANYITADVVAGAATAGIPHAATLANLLELPLIYVRSMPKDHGMKNQVEGILQKDQRTIVVEDLVSTGRSALKVIEAIRAKGGLVDHCLSIFSYGFKETDEAFGKGACGLLSLLTFPQLLAEAEDCKNISPRQSDLLRNWYQDPFDWGEHKGFSRDEKQ